MRKLLLSLCAIGSFSMAFANYLPNGNYSGFLTSSKGTVDSADASQTTIINDMANVIIPQLQDLRASKGKLSGNIINMGQGNTNCISNPSFSATAAGIPITTHDVILTNCAFDEASKTFTGDFNATIIFFVPQSGRFSFTLQQ
ncbi:MAG: hypothetical protein LW807_00180 [Proteobacteria bacterium]|jgi:hypothetical protein|nr:hypothetical protein [Pseudomonadota bacterium]